MPSDRMLVLLIVVLVLLAVFALPVFPYAVGWSFYPSTAAFILVIVLVLVIASGRP